MMESIFLYLKNTTTKSKNITVLGSMCLVMKMDNLSPIQISKETFEDQMNLLLITKDEKKHYVLIKDFNAFMYNQSKHEERKHFCMYCLQCFSSERVLANHVNNCLTINGNQAINMPKKGENILRFNNFHKQLPVPFVIYADFEAITKKVQGCKQSEEMENEKNKRSYTETYRTHEDSGGVYKVICCYDDKYSKPIQTYRGENAVYKFMEKMLEEVEYCKNITKKHFNKPLVMTDNDEQRFKTMDGCHICGEKYADVTKMCALETIVTSLENSGAQLTKNVT